MVVLSLLLFWLYVGYKHAFMTNFSYGSHHVLMSKCICYHVDLMVFLSFLWFWLYVGYKHGFMIELSYGSLHVLFSK